MDQFQGTIGQKIARAASAFEKERTKRGRDWVAVFMNEDTIVIELHGCLTAVEKALAQSPAGAAEVREFHRRLFAYGSGALLRTIKSLTGMEVRDTTAAIDPTTGSVVQVFTTDTVAEQFVLAHHGPAGAHALGHGPPCRHESGDRRAANKNRTGYNPGNSV
jgi:uncharacterized protein YbcI